MRFEHEFTVAVPLDQAWRALADAGAVVAALPGAELHAVDGVHTGRVLLDGATKLACEATVTAVDRDDDDHVATVALHGREVDGPAIGSAVLRSRLREHDASTTVSLTADLLSTGHEPGNGFRDAARGIFEALAEGLERQARERPPAAATPPRLEVPPVPAPVAAPRAWPERLAAQKRPIGAAAGLVIAAAVLRRRRGGRRRF